MVTGTVEYYDQRFIRITRKGEANLFIFKHDIKYFYEGQRSMSAIPSGSLTVEISLAAGNLLPLSL